MQRLGFLLLLITVLGCSSKVSTTGTATPVSNYSEDLSMWRPKDIPPTDTIKNNSAQSTDGKLQPTKYVEPKLAVNHQLDAILDSISEVNLNNGYVDGFTIQIYSGVKREEALNAKKQLSVSLPDLDSDVQYVQPNFRVRSGKYYDRLAAQKNYQAIKRYFPNAILIPDRIPIN